jgi:hypothetical protein
MSDLSAVLRKRRENFSLAKRVLVSGTVADMPCTRCYRLKLSCVISEASSRCGNCVKAKKTCDGVLVASSREYFPFYFVLKMTDFWPVVERVMSQKRSLEREEEEAGEHFDSLNAQLLELQNQLAEAAGRLSRIRKTRKKAEERGEELFRRGVAEADAEVAAEQSAVQDLQQLGVPNDVDWSSLGVGLDFEDLGPLIPPNGETSLSAPES